MSAEPTRGEVAHYRSGGARRDLLSEVYDWLNVIPTADLAVAESALSWLRGAAGRTDLRYAAGRFYVLGDDGLWRMDDEANGRTSQLLQRWAIGVRLASETFDADLRAVHAAATVDDDAAFLERYTNARETFAKRGPGWARRAQSAEGRKRVLADLQGLVRVDSPELFDADPDVLAVANGIVNLRTGELRRLRADDYATRRVDVAYDRTAEAPQWTAFLRDILVHEDGSPDEPLIEWMQRLVGYGITGHTREQIFANFHGQGSNGKSVLMETVGDLFAAISATSKMDTFEVRKGSGPSSDLARLRGARLVFAAEGEVGARLSAATIKRITGEDKITARELYRPDIEFRPRFLLILASNHRADVLDSSEGFWRRLRAVRFRRYFAPHERDNDLRTRLLASEAPGILRWAVEGAQAWYAEGMSPPDTVTAEGDAYRAEMDRLGEFLATRTTVGDDSHVERCEDVWRA